MASPTSAKSIKAEADYQSRLSAMSGGTIASQTQAISNVGGSTSGGNYVNPASTAPQYVNPNTGKISANLERFNAGQTGATGTPVGTQPMAEPQLDPNAEAPQAMVDQASQLQNQVNQLSAQKGLKLQQNAQGGFTAVPDLKAQANQKLNILNQSGQQFTSAGQAGAALDTASKMVGGGQEPPSILGGVQEVDSNFDSLFTEYDKFFSPQEQRVSLLDEYNKLSKSLGIDAMNAELLDAKRIIEGTEEDVRAEITAVGGFATDSQVLALSNARNKSLIKNYNYLLDTKNAATTQLTTMMNLSIQDRQFAEAEFDRKLGFAFKVAEFQQTATNNARQTYLSLGEKMGWDTLLTTASPYEKSLIQKTLGVSSQALSQLATASAQQRALTGQENALDMKIKEQQLYNLQLTGRKAEKELGIGVPTSPLTLSKAHSDVQQIDNIIKSSALDSTVGTSFLSRAASGFGGVLGRFATGAIGGAAIGAAAGAPFAGIGAIPGAIGGALLGGFGLASQGAKDTVTGARADLIADVEQLRSSLSLDQLTQAKAEGATFGALDRNEWKVLEGAATKLGTYAIKDEDNNVLGYRASERGFIKEMDKINYYAKLDYILKGGVPEDVGAVVKPDGTVWIQNSDGSVSQLQ